MRTAISFAFGAALLGSAVAAPVKLAARDTNSSMTMGSHMPNTTGVKDLDILQFAYSVELLEEAFYRQGIERFSAADYASAGEPSWVFDRFTEIVAGEQEHIKAIASTIQSMGGKLPELCNYTFGFDTVKEFLAMAPVVNGLGPAAYSGAGLLVQDKSVLAANGQIYGAETRHATWARSAVLPQDPFAQAFEVPVYPQEAYTIVSQFIDSCPSDSVPLFVTSNNNVAITPNKPGYSQGDSIQLEQVVPYGAVNGVGAAKYTPKTAPPPTAFANGLYAAFLSGSGGLTSYPVVPLGANGTVTIPAGVTGQSYLLVVNSPTEISQKTTVAGPVPIVVDIEAKVFDYQKTGPMSD